jgi:hypothetical protein
MNRLTLFPDVGRRHASTIALIHISLALPEDINGF